MSPWAVRGRCVALVFLSVAAALAPAMPASAVEDAEVAHGHEIAQAACSPCHAIGPTGASPKVEALPFRDISRKYPVDSLQETLAEGVMVGHPGMPEFKMNETEIGDFLAFLKSVQVP